MRASAVLASLLVATLAVALVFAAAPSIDLMAAALFYRGDNRFAGQTPWGEGVRRVIYWIPTLLFLADVALYALRRFGRSTFWAPSGRGVLFLALSFAIGPGLLVNTILKDHAHRPRPYQTDQFGGPDAFRPFYRLDGGCARNCSFVSGEGAAAAWTVAPALLLPPQWRAAGLAAAAVFTLGASLLRMAFGGHYLSDSLFAVVFTWLVIWAIWRLLRPDPAIRAAPARAPEGASGAATNTIRGRRSAGR